MRISPPRFVSLFSGCGGFDLGFVQAGFRCVAAFDINANAVATHTRNLGSQAIVADLSSHLPDSPILRNPDVVIAGSPCQGFSTAGKRDLLDPRNKLLIHAAEIAVSLKPKAVVIENVTGVVSGRQRKFWDKMIRVFHAAGYRVRELLCDARNMGVPQKRKRILAIAWSTGQELTLALPRRTCGVLRDALARINGAPNHAPRILDPQNRAGIIARHIGPGQKLSNVRSGKRSVHTWNIPEIFGRTERQERLVLNALLSRRRQKRIRDYGDADPVTAKELQLFIGRPVASILNTLVKKGYVRRIGQRYDLVHTFNGKFRRLSWDDVAPTVDGRYGDPYYFLHPDEHRGFTVRETARIQGFPDTFIFLGSEHNQYQMIGNAVPPPMAQAIAQCVLNEIVMGRGT